MLGVRRMFFNSSEFIFVFLPSVLLLTWLALWLFGRPTAVVILIAASLIFYGSWSIWAIWVLVTSTLANLGLGYAMLRVTGERRRKALLTLAVLANLLVLGYFKYANFFLDNLRALGFEPGSLAVIFPLGISFYTFQKIAFVMDIYRGRITQIRPREFVLMVVFFPQLIAGPIVHYRQVVPQFLSSLSVTWDSIALGLSVFAFGLAKKVFVADTLAIYVTPRFTTASQGPIEFFSAWVGALAYTFQLYFDFSGYSDMAIGLGLMFGVLLPLNFFSPYKSTSIIDFWRRWHITLSAFLRDYLYIPLGGNRHGARRRYANLMLVMLIGGLWHGAAWTFAFWGGLHGVYLAINQAWRNAGLRLPAMLAWPLTFMAVVMGWVFFRAPDFTTAWNMLKGMSGVAGFELPTFVAYQLHLLPALERFTGDEGINSIEFIAVLVVLPLAALIALVMPNTMQIFGLHAEFEEGVLGNSKLSTPTLKMVLSSPPAVGIVLWAGLFGVALQSRFLYFQF